MYIAAVLTAFIGTSVPRPLTMFIACCDNSVSDSSRAHAKAGKNRCVSRQSPAEVAGIDSYQLACRGSRSLSGASYLCAAVRFSPCLPMCPGRWDAMLLRLFSDKPWPLHRGLVLGRVNCGGALHKQTSQVWVIVPCVTRRVSCGVLYMCEYRATIAAKKLEPQFQSLRYPNGKPITEFYYNKGL